LVILYPVYEPGWFVSVLTSGGGSLRLSHPGERRGSPLP